LQLIAIGLRNEGVREWNFTLRGMGDRELLAAAQLACDHEVWDRCINTSERTRAEVDMQQRFPMPFRREVSAIGARDRPRSGLCLRADAPGVALRDGRALGRRRLRTDADHAGHRALDREEDRARLPPVADRRPRHQPAPRHRATSNSCSTTSAGSQALAAAGLQRRPGPAAQVARGPWLEPAAWAENIPFPETRDYVKKVLSNAMYYAAVMGDPGTCS
jgi:soluble lytic murein transglycosylase